MKKVNNKNYLLIILVILITTICFRKLTFSKNVNYAMEPILSKDMSKKGFFDFDILTNQKIKLPIMITNQTNREIKIKTYISNSRNDNGAIVYDQKEKPQPYKETNPKLSSMVIGEKSKIISLKGNQKKKVYFTLKTPTKPIDGTILGGISSEDVEHDDNIFYSVSVALHHSVKNPSLDNLKINQFIPSKDSVKFNFINNQAEIISNLSVDARIYNSEKEIIKKVNGSYSMVPQSYSPYVLNYEDLSPDFYVMKVILKDQKGHEKK